MLSPLPLAPARGIRIARAAAAFAILLVLEATLAGFFNKISSVTLISVLASALFFALVGFLFTVIAFRDIWRTGAPGFGAAMGGFVLVLLALIPFAGFGAASFLQPASSGVTTDPANPPETQSNRERLPDAFAFLSAGTASERQQAADYPEILPKSYPISTVETYAAARRAVADLGWSIRNDDEPADEDAIGNIRVEARTLLFALPSDIAIRISPDGTGARVDLSAVMRLQIRDLGENARLIKAFMTALDDTLTRPAG